MGLLLVELALRLRSSASGAEFLLARTPELYDTSIFTSDPDTIVALLPGTSATMSTAEYHQTVQINSLGIRGPEPSSESGNRRILMVGDSFTLGVQVPWEDLFPTRVGRQLGEELGDSFEVFNGGVDSHGTPHATAHAARLIPQLKPEALVLVFFTGNDFQDNQRYQSDRQRPKNFRAKPEGPGRWLRRRSFLAAYASVWSRARMVADSADQQRYRNELAIFTDPKRLGRERRRTRRYLNTLGKQCQRYDLECTVAIAPPAFVVHESRQASTFGLFGLDTSQLDVDGPARLVLESLPEGMGGVDLAPALRAAADEGESLYFTLDGHWTEAGHAVVADALTEYLEPRLAGSDPAEAPP